MADTDNANNSTKPIKTVLIKDIQETVQLDDTDFTIVKSLNQYSTVKRVSIDTLRKKFVKSSVISYASTNTTREIKLATTSGLPSLSSYCDGMIFGFKSLVDSGNFIVTISVDNLPAKVLLLPPIKNGARNAKVRVGDACLAMYDAATDKFYLLNSALEIEESYRTNEYLATGAIDTVDHNVTHLTLTSAAGAKKTKLYNGMSILFVCPMDTTHTVGVTIDGLQEKELVTGTHESLSDSIATGDLVLAIYDSSAGKFINRNFTSKNQLENTVSVEDVLINLETGDTEVVSYDPPGAPLPTLPPAIFVGDVQSEDTVTTISEALSLAKADQTRNPGVPIRIIIKSGYVIKEQIVLNAGTNYSNISLTSEDDVVLLNAANFKRNGRLNSSSYNFATFLLVCENTICFNFNIKLRQTGAYPAWWIDDDLFKFFVIYVARASNFYSTKIGFENFIKDGALLFAASQSNVDIENASIIGKSSYDGRQRYAFQYLDATIKLKDCTLTGGFKSVFSTASGIAGAGDCSITVERSNFTAPLSSSGQRTSFIFAPNQLRVNIQIYSSVIRNYKTVIDWIAEGTKSHAININSCTFENIVKLFYSTTQGLGSIDIQDSTITSTAEDIPSPLIELNASRVFLTNCIVNMMTTRGTAISCDSSGVFTNCTVKLRNADQYGLYASATYPISIQVIGGRYDLVNGTEVAYAVFGQGQGVTITASENVVAGIKGRGTINGDPFNNY